jgi:hypothetical protein
MKKIRTFFVALVFLGQSLFCGCHRADAESWTKPHRVISVPADVRKALILASSSSVLSKYGPLAGVLNELLPKDLKDLTVEPVAVDWSHERCIWTFDTRIDAVMFNGSVLKVRSTREENTGVRLWFFDKPGSMEIRQIQFD